MNNSISFSEENAKKIVKSNKHYDELNGRTYVNLFLYPEETKKAIQCLDHHKVVMVFNY